MKNNNFLNLLLIVLFSFLPILKDSFLIEYGTTGVRIFYSTIALILILILGKFQSLPLTRIIYLWIALVSCVFISNTLSNHAPASWAKASEFLLYISLFIGLIHTQKTIIFPFQIGLMIFIIIYSLFFFNFWHHVPNPHEVIWAWNMPFYSNIRHFGYMVQFVFCISLFSFFHSPKKSIYFLAFSSLTLSTFYTIWCGSRANMALALLSLLITYITTKKILTPWKWIVAALTTGFALALYYQVTSSNLDRMIERSDLSTQSSRLKIWFISIQQMDNHWLIGHGTDAYAHFYYHGSTSAVMPHSSIVQFLTDYGLIGLLLTIFIFTILGKSLFQIVKQNTITSGISLAAFTTIIQSFVDGNLYHSEPLFYLSIALACLFAFQQESQISIYNKSIKLLLLFITSLFLIFQIWQLGLIKNNDNELYSTNSLWRKYPMTSAKLSFTLEKCHQDSICKPKSWELNAWAATNLALPESYDYQRGTWYCQDYKINKGISYLLKYRTSYTMKPNSILDSSWAHTECEKYFP